MEKGLIECLEDFMNTCREHLDECKKVSKHKCKCDRCATCRWESIRKGTDEKRI